MTQKDDPFAEARAKIRANQEARRKAEEEKERARLEAQRRAAESRQRLAERASAAQARAKAISKEALMEKLEAMAKGKQLNWKTSIADLLRLLGLDSSYEARKALAQKLGCPAELMSDSFKMNSWLYEKVIEQLAAHGGEVPEDWK